MEDVKLFSNWKFENEDKVKNLVTVTTLENSQCSIDQVTEDSCVCLTEEKTHGTNSKPKLEIKSNKLIKEIKILSEGSLIEVFGTHDEYLFTCASDFIDDWEGMAVYSANIILPDISSCKLKFTRIKQEGRLWLYTIQVLLSQKEPPHSLFNFENVNKFIRNPSQQISEKADKFRKFFELCAKNSSPSSGFNIHRMLSVINQEYNTQYSDCKQILTDYINCSNVKGLNDSLNFKREISNTHTMEVPVECQFLKGYIDKKFEELREDIMKQIDVKLGELRNENNTKLDQIITFLENSRLSLS